MSKPVINILLIIATANTAALAVEDLSLEPCINGGVSARGTHVDQAAEDIARYTATLESFDEYALEPCINGDVSPLGTAPGGFFEESLVDVTSDGVE